MAAAHEEQQVQIEMIKAIVQSQSALARMLNQMADLTAHSEAATKLLKDNIRLLSMYQLALCGMVTGFQTRIRKTGTAAPPWLHTDCQFEEMRVEEGEVASE
ncbi:hypothetical protein [Paenibacillus popilliae]|uniref:Uncharacterized protein n=1 Tax=Paenibacillus popilliae TaxID=78057 RepID=A0ABY3AJ98_PAEPP|nr:hypothetical protein [Paenibacillus sp. SDF0028]TQR42118.1 hypothetical protein C7Y44_23520 [Paenibacillus sp. SDF0028]